MTANFFKLPWPAPLPSAPSEPAGSTPPVEPEAPPVRAASDGDRTAEGDPALLDFGPRPPAWW
ncbi:hypothetical protein ABZZ36_42955 [Actinacidiphila glaucinigra]|uniref:hypothetical protein n=1 Tax=Actinacidiphila glaucinigra TaxID=235986 RepID=UPI0033AD36B1